MKLPEIDKLEEVVGQYDFLVQEGVFYTKEEKKRALFLYERLGTLIKTLITK